MSNERRAERGFGLIELVVTIVILGIALTAVLGGIAAVTRRSADPVVLAQANAIAEAYLEEILLRRYRDPDAPGSGCSFTGPGASEARETFDDIGDYAHFSGPAALQAVPGDSVDGYEVSVRVLCTVLNDLPALGDAARIEVTVTHRPTAYSVRLTGFRTNHDS